MTEPTILIVEDDEAIRLGLGDALKSEGYRVLACADGRDGLRVGLQEDPDLIVLDLMLPGMHGFEVLRSLRADHVETPVLLLTALGQEEDRVKGLDLGADDYLVKPFGLAELLARVRSRLRAWDRERGLSHSGVLRFAGITVDFGARSAVRDGEDIGLTPLEFSLLECFAAHEGKAVSRGQLLREVWNDADVVSRAVDTAMLGLRKRVEPEPATPRYLVSVRGLGYRFRRRP
jgi:two-component system alkaline phosphatase synthesis response regulator PhoP